MADLGVVAMNDKPVKVIWSTPDLWTHLAFCARVSNPEGQSNTEKAKLLSYLARNGEWSPFEMVNVVVEVNTTREISRQILRHRSFSFQEFSGRYQFYDKLPEPELKECRLQDPVNRQSSLPTENVVLKGWWENVQQSLLSASKEIYNQATNEHGIAKEVARTILLEGLTPTRMYINGTVRSWIHYYNLRSASGTQLEHRKVAEAIGMAIEEQVPGFIELCKKANTNAQIEMLKSKIAHLEEEVSYLSKTNTSLVQNLIQLSKRHTTQKMIDFIKGQIAKVKRGSDETK